MLKNDYRRSLILLRSNAAGYSGHVRLERRTLTGSMAFIVQSPDGGIPLKAALIGSAGDGSCFACALGELKKDLRGQTALSLTFDPRNLCGRELEQYKWIAVLEVAAGICRLVLFGNLNGHADVDWNRALAAVCALFGEESTTEAVNDLPEAKTEMPETEIGASEETAEAQSAALSNGNAVSTEEEIGEAPSEETRNAGDALGIDMSIPWPNAVENLRRLFMDSPVLENAPDSDHVYISAPMPQGCASESCAVGIRIENGAPVSVVYALPSAYTPEPPAGMEDYAWQGDSNRGWWRFEADANTGQAL